MGNMGWGREELVPMGWFDGERTVSNRVNLSGEPWRRAHVVQRERKGKRGLGSGVGSVVHVAMLERNDGDALQVVIDVAKNTSRHARQLRSTRHTLRPVNDGQAIGISSDERSWKYLALDAPMPFFCGHHAFPLRELPTTRSVVLEILSSCAFTKLAPERNHVDRTWLASSSPGFGREVLMAMRHTWWEEVRAALRWADVHARDPEVRQAVLEAAWRPGPQLDAHAEELDSVLSTMASTYVDVRHSLLDALTGDRPGRALRALAELDDDPVREQILDRLSSLPNDDDGAAAGMVWCLLRSGIGEARADHRRVLVDLALRGDGHTDARLRTASRLAVWALSAVGDLDALRSLSAGPRRAHRDEGVLRVNTQAPAEPLRSLPSELSDDRHVWYDVACHAIAMLSTHQGAP